MYTQRIGALDAKSEALAARLLDELNDRQRAELSGALATAERLLLAATVTFTAVDPHSAEAQWAMGQYFTELDQRFPTGFDPGDALGDDASAMQPPFGEFIVVRSDAKPVACGGLQRIDATTAEIKRMWVSPEFRGSGIGGRLLRHLEDRCVAIGYHRIVLDTNATLLDAIAMYERAGYTAIDRYNDNPYAERWFAKPVA